jgi:hypothetical protein
LISLKYKGEGRNLKEKLNKTLSTLLILAMVMSAIPAFAGTPSEPHNANAMWIEPATISLTTANPSHTIGYKFNITLAVNISVTEEVGAWQARVNFNPAYVKADRAGLTGTGGLKSNWFQPFSCFAADLTIDNVTGYVFWGETILGAAVTNTGAGTLCWIEFEVVAVPGKNEEITMTFVIDRAKSYVLDEFEAEIPMTKYDAQYTFTWAQPTTKPKLAVDPLLKEFGPDPPSAVGQAFDVKVYIRNLAAAWGLTNASFRLSYNTTLIDVLGAELNITINTADFNGVNEVTVTHGDPWDTIDIIVRTTKTLSDVLVATIKFTVMQQQESPPAPPYPWAEISPLTLSNILLYDHAMEITTDPPDNGQVKIYALRTLPLPWLEVQPSVVVKGPEPAVSQTFDVDIVVKDLDKAWYVCMYQFRLLFNGTLLEGVTATEGPLFQDPTWNLYGTVFLDPIFEEDPIYGWQAVIGGFLLPNPATGEWNQTEFPHADNVTGGVLATITFHVIYQEKSPCEFTGEFLDCDLELIAFWEDGSSLFIDRNGNYVPSAFEKYVNGYYMIYDTPSTGRFIDLYGGAWNAGYGAYPFPAPYGGQGKDQPMDLVIPQSEVKFFAKVEYNCWPVQSKDVGFEIEGPFIKVEDPDTGEITYEPKDPGYKLWAKLVARTDSNGIATVVFRMPWPCENPEDVTGIWLVTATVNVADVVITDTMLYYYEYMVYITKVTTGKFYYYHDDTVHVCVEYRTHSMQKYPALFAIVITDELGVPFGMDASFTTMVGGAKWCTWKEGKFCVDIYIPKWAFAGYAYVHVSVYDKDPTEGGFAWYFEYAPLPKIYILPLFPPTVIIDPAEATMNMTAGETATFTAIASGGWGPYTYQWYGDGSPLGTASTQTIYSWSPGTHEIRVVVTDFMGYTAEAFATLTVVE